MALWINTRTCECDSSIKEKSGAVEFDGSFYCQFCRGIVDSSDPRISTATPVPGAQYDVSTKASFTVGLPVTTLDQIPGYDIVQILGLVHGVGNVSISVATASVAFTTAGKADRAMQKAEDDMRKEATLLKADAVVGVQIAATSAGMANLNRAQTLQLVGTAVRLQRQQEPVTPKESDESKLEN